MSKWTTLDVVRESRDYSILKGRNLRASDHRHGSSFSPDGWQMEKHTKEYSSHLCSQFDRASKTTVVLLDCDKAQLAEAVGLVQNCVTVPYDGDEGPQHHLYSLDWLPAIGWWYGGLNHNDYDKDVPAKLPDVFNVYVKGKHLDTLEMCRTCPNYLNKTLGMCKPLHRSCDRENVKPVTWDFISLNGEKSAWFGDHVMKISQLETKFSVKFAYRGDLSIQGSFELTSFDTLTCDKDKLKSHKAELSARSVKAAGTRRIRKTLCTGCLVADQRDVDSKVCSSDGGLRCKGPIYEEDYEYALARNCEPWMVQALSWAMIPDFDPRKHDLAFKGSRINDYRVLGPVNGAYGAHPKGVLLAKIGKSLTEHTTVSFADMLKAVGQTEVTSISELTSKFVPGDFISRSGLPLPSYVLALAYTLSRNRSSNYLPSGACTYRDLVEVRVNYGNITLMYSLPGYYCTNFKVDSLTSIYGMPGGQRSHGFEFATYRKVENDMYTHFSVVNNVPMKTDVWRALFKEHEQDWVGSPLIPVKEMAKLARLKKAELHPESVKPKKKKAVKRK